MFINTLSENSALGIFFGSQTPGALKYHLILASSGSLHI